jgi:hypothetical protein
MIILGFNTSLQDSQMLTRNHPLKSIFRCVAVLSLLISSSCLESFDSLVEVKNPPRIVKKTITRLSGGTGFDPYNRFGIGDSALISIETVGISPFTFQWYLNDTLLKDAHSNALLIEDFSFNKMGYYQCVVSNSAGSDSSETEFIYLRGSPSIRTQPDSLTTHVGDTAVFRVTVLNSPQIAFQWQKNGVDIEGATEPVLVVRNVTIAESGSLFRCFVRNDIGWIYSDWALLEVKNVPTP